MTTAPAQISPEYIRSLAHRAAGMDKPGGNPRLKAILERILSDLFYTMSDFDVTADEAWAAISYLTKVGKADEAGLLAPGLGIEHFIDVLTDAAEARAGLKGGTPRTIEGPLYIAGAPQSDGFARLDDGSDISGRVLIVEGVIRDLAGAPVAGAMVDVWHANKDGFYSHFDPTGKEKPFNLRRRIRAGADGKYKFRTMVPKGYGCPPGGPTDTLLGQLGRHAQRPSHVHFFVSADGCRKLTTQFNLSDDPLTYDDFAFATKKELVADPLPVTDPAKIAANGLNAPYTEIRFDFTLQKEVAAARTAEVHRERVSA